MTDSSYIVKEKDFIASDIAGYLKLHEEKDLLRFLTCGSVDDGKSTLIGRLLYDSHMIYEDQLAAVQKDSKIHGTTGDDFDPALLTDGLKAEREQGITIDVAYRYFSTDKRKFIIADCPGHEQYTRNMATGASTANLAVILIDARNGVITQTKRHSFICSLLGIKHVIVAINKMDLMDWSEEVYEKIRSDYNDFVPRLNFSDIHFIPVSALKGDNVVDKSSKMPWYEGPTVLKHLETVNLATDRNLVDMRFPVQYVQRPNLNFRGFSGTVASGILRIGDEVMSLPSRNVSRIKDIYGPDGKLDEAFSPMSVTVTLEDEIDVSRGNMLVPSQNLPHVGNEFEAMLVWMHEDAAQEGRSYLVKQTSNTTPGAIKNIRYKVDVNTMRKAQGAEDSANTSPRHAPCAMPPAHLPPRHAPCAEPPASDAMLSATCSLQLNETGRVHMTLHRPVAFDPYDRNRSTGAFILIDRMSNITVAAGMIISRIVPKERTLPKASRNIVRSESLVSDADRAKLFNQRGATLWMTGLSGSGKSTVARQLERELVDMGHACIVLDGDNIRHGLNRDLGFSAEDRQENIRRIAEVARLFNDAGLIVITAFISPYRQDRAQARKIICSDVDPAVAEISPAKFVEVHIATPLDVCEQRDPKGLYKKARAGEISQFTGISDPYELPLDPEMTIDTSTTAVSDSVAKIVAEMQQDGIIG